MKRQLIALAMAGLAALVASQTPLAADPMTPRGSGLLLVRIDGKPANLSLVREPRTIAGYRLSPLFRSPPERLANEDAVAWFIAAPRDRLAEGSGWDQAYQLASAIRETKHPAFSTIKSVYVEPDQEQEWEPKSAPATGWPKGPAFAWHLRDEFTQLAKARKNAAPHCEARISILDTGINPVHVTVPRHVRVDLGWNYVCDNDDIAVCDKKDVADPGTKDSPLDNPGHGTATLALLAGNRIKKDGFDDDLGGAPDATVIPVRIATSVVHFWTRTMAQGIDHATNLPRDAGKDYCDVVSISMGGVASRAWADAVNRAYEKGILIVAAAGNNFSDIPTRYTVYPSRFARVTTALGITAARTPYRVSDNPGASGMQGNYGPPSMSWKSIAAYTPNVPWAWLKDGQGQPSRDGIEMDGGGTSAATPQIAAAASLWLAKNGSAFQSGWHRVEAARWALLESAQAPKPAFAEELGRGSLRAYNALAKIPNQAKLVEAKPAAVSFPFLRLLLGWDEPDHAPDAGLALMYEVEAFNLAMGSPVLTFLTALTEKDVAAYKARISEIAHMLASRPDISKALRTKLLATR